MVSIFPAVSWLDVLVGTIVYMVIGMLWYSPLVLGKEWMKAMGMKGKPDGAGKAMFGMVITALVTAYVLAVFIDQTGVTTVFGGALTGFWIWLGFIATSTIATVLFENRSFQLYVISAAYYLVAVVVTGGIMAIL